MEDGLDLKNEKTTEKADLEQGFRTG